MRKTTIVGVGALLLGGGLGLRVLAQPQEASDDGPERIAITTRVDGHRVSFIQGDRPGGGCIVSTTRLEVCVPAENDQLPPGPCRGGIRVRVEAHDESVANAAGLLGAIGIASGLDVNAILIGLRQAGLDIESMTELGRDGGVVFPPGPPTLPTALVDLVNAALVADRPGGGCLQTQPMFARGAAALGFTGTCTFSTQNGNQP
jgi:hypothetical protein